MRNPARPVVLAASAAVALIALAGCSSSSDSSSGTTGTASQSAVAASPTSSVPSGTATSSTGLTLSAAEAACQLAGVRQYPYGFDPHWSLGFVSADASSGAWVIKAHADVADDSGTRTDKVVTCTVNGTDDAPKVVSLTVA